MTTRDSAHVDASDATLSELLRSPDFQSWRTQVDGTRGCSAPIHLSGSSGIYDRDGALLAEREGTILAPCGNRRASVCPACSHRYAGDTFHLMRAGLTGDPAKGVPHSAAGHPRAFVTLTAPSFGPVHTRRISGRGKVKPCACGEHHREHDTRIATPLQPDGPDGYDYVGAVLWQANSGVLWNRFTTALRRQLAARLGVRARDLREIMRVSYAKVAEYQQRGLVHFHAVIRLDGPDGPTTPPPPLTDNQLRAAIIDAATAVRHTVARPDGARLTLTWGTQLDVRAITPAGREHLEDDQHTVTEAALASYVAKYATKGTGTSAGTDRPVRDIAHVEHLDINPHHRRMIETAWELGGLADYEPLNLRRWAHMLGFRGHFLTKSHAYSTTFRAIRAERRTWQLVRTLAELDAATDDPNHIAPDLNTITVINDWAVVHIGHRNDAERELAQGIAERHLNQHRTRTERRTEQRRAAA